MSFFMFFIFACAFESAGLKKCFKHLLKIDEIEKKKKNSEGFRRINIPLG